ncbi:MAG: M28 family peptidase [Gemmatimonadetes bacterium]|nr:M28 family peptidase [Gemmatimonadota bacterium]
MRLRTGLLAAAAVLFLPELTLAQAPRGFPEGTAGARSELERFVRATPDSTRIRGYVRAMTREPHVAGTPGSKRVAEWALRQFRSWGLDARIEVYEALSPQPLEQVLEFRGARPWRARLREEVFAEDPDSRHPGIMPPYAAYGADGNVTAEVVYVNYGLPSDYAALDKMGISVRGRIVLARAGPHHRSVKSSGAMERGAVGLIMYNDPREDGFWLNRPYPRGPMRPPHAVERGGIRDDQFYTGDPLSPGWASKPGSRRLRREEAQGLVTIPVLSISYADASVLLDRMEGPVVPNDSWKGALGLTYHVGPSRDKLHMAVRSDWRTRPLYNVVARLPGVDTTAWVIAGNHHDAWVFGADDPVGAAATVMEAARTLAELRRTGWQPQRTVVFALWDGEEYGILGSTEWAEDHGPELQAKAIAYVQGDNYRRGVLTSSGSTTLESFMREVARDTPDPATGRSALDVVIERALSTARTAADSAGVRERPFPLTPIGANTDYAAFIQHLGISSLHIAWRNTGRGTYHSAFDSFAYFERFLDPGFRYGRAQAGAFASTLLRLADAPVLPWSFVDASRAYQAWGRELVDLARTNRASVDLAPLTDALSELSEVAATHEAAFQRVMRTSRALDADALGAINRDTWRSEQELLLREGLPGRPWFRYPISGPSTYNGSVARTFPVLRDALELGELDTARSQVDATAAAIRRLTVRVRQLAQRLTALTS